MPPAPEKGLRSTCRWVDALRFTNARARLSSTIASGQMSLRSRQTDTVSVTVSASVAAPSPLGPVTRGTSGANYSAQVTSCQLGHCSTLTTRDVNDELDVPRDASTSGGETAAQLQEDARRRGR